MRYENMKRWVLRHQDAALSVPDKTGSDQSKRPGASRDRKALHVRARRTAASRATTNQPLCEPRELRTVPLFYLAPSDAFLPVRGALRLPIWRHLWCATFLHRIRERDDSQQHSGCDSDYFCHRTSSSLPRRVTTRQAVACLLGQIRAKSGCLSPRGQMIEQIHRQREHHSRGALACDVVQRCEIA